MWLSVSCAIGMRVATGTHAFLDRQRRSTELAMREHARYRPPSRGPGPPGDPRHGDSALHRPTHRDDHPGPDRSPPRPGRRVLLSWGTSPNAARTMATKIVAAPTAAIGGRGETARSGQEEALTRKGGVELSMSLQVGFTRRSLRRQGRPWIESSGAAEMRRPALHPDEPRTRSRHTTSSSSPAAIRRLDCP